MERRHWVLTTGLTRFTLLLFALTATAPEAASIEQDALKKLDFIRSIRVTSDDKLLNEYNRKLDETWEFFRENRSEVVPILAEQLGIELKKEYLIGELTKIRTRMLYRISDEALSDVKVTNALMNALHYRPY